MCNFHIKKKYCFYAAINYIIICETKYYNNIVAQLLFLSFHAKKLFLNVIPEHSYFIKSSESLNKHVDDFRGLQ